MVEMLLARGETRGARARRGGTTILAAVGIGAFATIAEAVPAMTRVERVFEPDPRRGPRYDAMFQAYRSAIDALRPIGLIRTDGPR